MTAPPGPGVLRIAVQPGTATTRVACADPAPGIVAELDGWVAPVDAVRLLWADPPEPLVVGPGDAALSVGGALPRIVVDAGASGTVLTLLTYAGAVWSGRLRAGGDDCDDALAALLGQVPPPGVRAYRERFSLQPAATPPGDRGVGPVEVQATLLDRLRPIAAAVAELGRDVPVAEIVLVGGLARNPLLAELLDALEIAPVRVPPDPAAAAVLGALEMPVGPLPPTTATNVAARAGAEAEPGRRWWARRRRPEPGPLLLPRPRRGLRGVGTAVVGVMLVAGIVALPLTREPPDPPPELAQYGYRFVLPAGWAHTGGRPELRRTIVTPERAPAGAVLVSVERAELGYDAGAEPARAAAELRAVYDDAVARGERLDGYDPAAHYAGRTGTAYRQQLADGAVDWFVLLDGTAQLSVGCRHTAAAETVARACEVVVGTLRPG